MHVTTPWTCFVTHFLYMSPRSTLKPKCYETTLSWSPPHHENVSTDGAGRPSGQPQDLSLKMYTFRYGSTAPNEHQPLLFDVNIFALADKYDISGLRQAAVRAFEAKLSSVSFDEFAETVSAIYTNTPPSVKELRKAAVNFAQMKLKSLARNEAFTGMMDSIGEFGKDLIKSMACEMERGPNQAGNIEFTCDTEFCKLRTMLNIYDFGHGWQRSIRWDDTHSRQYIRCPQCAKDSYANTSPRTGIFVDDSWFEAFCVSTCRTKGVAVFCSRRDQANLPEIRTKPLKCLACYQTLQVK